MPDSHSEIDIEIRRGLLETFVVNERMNQVVLEHLDPAAWRSRLAGSGGKVRTIADIVAHMHNVRRKWLRLSAPHIELPASLSRSTCTLQDARAALTESSARCLVMLEEALVQRPRRVENFVRDGWATPWPAGAAMVVYMTSHEAHHRGQICMLAHQLGFPLPASVTSQMWSWERLSKDYCCGLSKRTQDTGDS